jgi:Fur family transcriptional regulator, ferric uptake regulator
MAKQKTQSIKEEVAELRALIRGAGLRSTSARLAVLQHLRLAHSPITHADLAEELVPLGFDKATIFRNLADLTEADLVTRTELGDHVWRFEIRDPEDPHRGKHPHFVCVDCGKVTCFSDITFGKATQRRTEKVGRVTEILLKGHCHDCDAL